MNHPYINVNAQNNTGGTALHIASGHENPKVVKLLLSHHTNAAAADFIINLPNSAGSTALHLASMHGTFEVVEFLLNHTNAINVINLPNHKGNTPLHMACIYNGNLDVIKLIVEAGANVNLQNKLGNTPIDLAIESQYTSVVEYLEKEDATEKLSIKSSELNNPVAQQLQPLSIQKSI